MSVLKVWLNGEDISTDICTRNGKSNPFGWSSADLVHDRPVGGDRVEVKIGTLYCGEPRINEPGYTWAIEDD